MIAAAWATWKPRNPKSLGPGPAFVEAINAALAKMETPAMTQQEKTNPAPVTQTTGIETAPAEGLFLAETRDGDWIKDERYDNPFGDKNTVISRRTGKWWSPARWMPLPEKQNDTAWEDDK